MYTAPWRWRQETTTDREYVVLLTMLRVRGRRHLPRFGWEVWRVLRGLRHSAGLVGYSLAGQIRDRQYYTLSVWDSDTALEAFVTSEPHQHAMRALRGRLARTQFVRWTVSGSGVPPSWEAALTLNDSPNPASSTVN